MTEPMKKLFKHKYSAAYYRDEDWYIYNDLDGSWILSPEDDDWFVDHIVKPQSPRKAREIAKYGRYDGNRNLRCKCGGDKFTITSPPNKYETTAKCTECGKSAIVHSG